MSRYRWRNVLWAGALMAAASAQTPPPTNPAVVATIHRLILTDGSYQQVRQWEIKGDRVRYISTERNGLWEELPLGLVDWAATEKYARDHTDAGRAESAASADARALDAEEAEEKAESNGRTPAVAPKLHLPDRDGVWALDYYHDQPELVTLEQNSGDVNQRSGHNVLRSALNPLGGKKQEVRLDGEGSKIHLHGNQPAFFVSVSGGDDSVGPDALGVDTHGANGPGANSSPKSQYVIVELEQRPGYRVVNNITLSALGRMTENPSVTETTASLVPGGHWMKIVPRQPLTIGQYALMEVLAPREVNLSVWDFAIEPQSGDNANAILPLDR